MEPPNKRRKLGDSNEPLEDDVHSNRYAGYCRSGCSDTICHDGKGIQNVDGKIEIGRDFVINNGPTAAHENRSSVQDRRKTLMDSLGFTQMGSRRSTVKAADSTTCEWLLRHPAYMDWRDPAKRTDHYGFLWINGKPATGKSTLMKFAQKRMPKCGACASFFFNARGDDLEKSTLGMHRSLLLQLLETLPDLEVVLDDRDVFSEHQGGTPQWTVQSLQDLFSTAIRQLGRRQFTCFIDALDECDEQQVREMVSYFEDLARVANEDQSTLYICFSSRHYPTIHIQSGRQLTLENQQGHGQE